MTLKKGIFNASNLLTKQMETKLKSDIKSKYEDSVLQRNEDQNIKTPHKLRENICPPLILQRVNIQAIWSTDGTLQEKKNKNKNT